MSLRNYCRKMPSNWGNLTFSWIPPFVDVPLLVLLDFLFLKTCTPMKGTHWSTAWTKVKWLCVRELGLEHRVSGINLVSEEGVIINSLGKLQPGRLHEVLFKGQLLLGIWTCPSRVVLSCPFCPKGPKIENVLKVCLRDWRDQARLKIQASHPPRPFFLWGGFWRPRLKISSEIAKLSSEIQHFKRDCGEFQMVGGSQRGAWAENGHPCFTKKSLREKKTLLGLRDRIFLGGISRE